MRDGHCLIIRFVLNLDDLAVAAGHSVDPSRWQGMSDELMLRVGARFGRVEPRRRARAFVLGLLAGLPRKNCWTIAQQAGEATPDGMQYLLERARWDADAVRDDVRGYVAEHLGDAGAVLVVDETGDLKKGKATAGVARQYTGTAGKVENAQVAVYLSYASPVGHALIDRELYLPQSWISDPVRCRAAGIPADAGFATKPALARQMIGRAAAAGVPFAWVGRRRGVRGQRAAARRSGSPADRPRAGRLPRPPDTGRSRAHDPRRRAGGPPAQAGLAAPVRRGRRQGPPLVRLGLDHHPRDRPGLPLAADPPQPANPGTGLLPLLLPAPGPAGHPGHGRPAQMDHRGELPSREGPGRPG